MIGREAPKPTRAVAAGAVLALCLCAAAAPAQDPKEKRQDALSEQARIEQELQKLEAKMAELIDVLRKKDQEHYAQKLEEGLKKLRSERVGVNVRAVIEHLSANRIEKALESG